LVEENPDHFPLDGNWRRFERCSRNLFILNTEASSSAGWTALVCATAAEKNLNVAPALR
jgi:hypothetical protein